MAVILHLGLSEVQGLILCFLILRVFLKALLNRGQSLAVAPSLCPANGSYRKDGVAGLESIGKKTSKHTRKWYDHVFFLIKLRY